ncbi:hypothetical protein Psi02_74900 [Planotetraspora silvatica]|uniref:Uncharacterized protein n=1 Tax=Planotetraspora silvatica TaxID=234614 RepID=A0A8J3XT13_9ACTN|nr:hypothetical protein [Planotetraspora silvatica]GII51066.1 hypothetical protein Psi02_74900 [Planotetraspora silvatica]
MSAPASQEAPRPEAPAAETSPETSGGAPLLTRPVSHGPGLVVLGAEDAEACSDGTCW